LAPPLKDPLVADIGANKALRGDITYAYLGYVPWLTRPVIYRPAAVVCKAKLSANGIWGVGHGGPT